MYTDWAHHYIPKVAGIGSFLINILLIYTVWKDSNVRLGDYRYLLIFFACYNLESTINETLVPTAVLDHRYAFSIFVVNGEFEKISEFGMILLRIRCSFVSAAYGILQTHFIYRPEALKKYFAPYGLILSILYCEVLMSIWFFAAYIFLHPDVEQLEYVKDGIAERFHVNASKLNIMVALYDIRFGITAALKIQNTSIGWAYSGGAIPLAIKYLQDRGLLKDFDFEYHVEFTECDLEKTVRAGLNFMKTLDYEVVIGPPCNQALKAMGALSTLYRKPVLGWGFVSESDLSDMKRFPYVSSALPNSETVGIAATKLLEMFSWKRVALVYYKNEFDHCKSVIEGIEYRLNNVDEILVNVVMKSEIDFWNNETTVSTLQSIKSRARVVLFCGHTGSEKRDYLIKIAQLGMNSNEYVHIMVSMRSVGYGVQTSLGKPYFAESGLTPLWESFTSIPDGLEETAKSGAAKVLVLDLSSEVEDKQYLQYLTSNVVYAVRAQPLNCQEPECLTANPIGMGAYARHLFDIILIYGMAISKLNSTDPEVYRDIEKLIPNFVTTIEGMTGLLHLDKQLSRKPLYQVYGLTDKFQQVSLININLINETTHVSLNYENESSAMWYHWDGVRPRDTPICGFTGRLCPLTFYEQFGVLIILTGTVAILAFLAFIIGWISQMTRKRKEQEIIRSEWQIPIVKLRVLEREGHRRRSLISMDSDSLSTSVNIDFLSNYTVQCFENEVVLTIRYSSQELMKREMEQIAKLRKMDHENVHKFLGLSIDGSQFIAVWKLCSRGSLQDIIYKGNFSMDYFFMFCMIRDIAEGLNYIHHSFVKVHGNLRSANCLVNDSWQVKLTDFGLDFLESDKKNKKRRLLWAAPEVLRAHLSPTSMHSSADIYSFAIVASEILTKKPAWNLKNREQSVEEIIYLVKKGGSELVRPDLFVDVSINETMLSLIRKCWSENPEHRPVAAEVCKSIFDLTPRTKNNLMDHVFKMLEEYTESLQIEISERTKELSIEKKKSDVLLERMLPKQVAEKLKLGQAVEPESFEMVTVSFSDLAKFTDVVSKCTPLQTVNLLNDLFCNFDLIIEKYDVYKVESIGDTFLCVSGLPIRNGVAHIKNIIDLALHFMEYVSTFKIPHLQDEVVQLRIGVNSGPCSAGVVGLSMPRYCLFGDTVNTASRMESNGKASMIHLSEAAHLLLSKYFPYQYETESRGDVIIKGKGVMKTFWVLGKSVEKENCRPQKIECYSNYDDENPIRSVSPYSENVDKLSEWKLSTSKIQI